LVFRGKSIAVNLIQIKEGATAAIYKRDRLDRRIVMFQRKIFATLVLLAGLAAAPALAQQQSHEQHHPAGMGMGSPGGGMSGGSMPGMGGMPMMGMMRMMMGEEGMGGMAMMAGHVEGRLAFLKTELKITEGQLPLWNGVADAIRANAKSMSAMMSGGTMAGSQTATLPEKLALREKMMTGHLDALRRFKAAVDPLYAALSPEQKKTADQLLMGPMGMM
jgi:LTXXQ motif family protein